VSAAALDVAAAAFAVMRYSQVEEGRVAAELADALPGPQVRLLHHVASVLLVAGESDAASVNVIDDGVAPIRSERLPPPAVTAPGLANQTRLVQPDLPYGAQP